MSLIAQGFLYPLMFVIVISIVIVIHELGHYWAGRYFGAAVESFSMGFGKSIFEIKDKNNTLPSRDHLRTLSWRSEFSPAWE